MYQGMTSSVLRADLSQIVSQNVGFIKRFDASDGRIAPRVGVAVHGDGGLAVTCHRRREVCVMHLFVDICDDGVPEGIFRGIYLRIVYYL